MWLLPYPATWKTTSISSGEPGVYNDSIRALQRLNQLGYGQNPDLQLDLVYNPQVPRNDQFSLTPGQAGLEQAYKAYLQEHFGIQFNHLFTITNLPIGRVKQYLQAKDLYWPYLKFLESHHKPGHCGQSHVSATSSR